MIQNCKSYQRLPSLMQNLCLTQMDWGENLCSFKTKSICQTFVEDLFGVSWEIYHIMKSKIKNAILKECQKCFIVRSVFKAGAMMSLPRRPEAQHKEHPDALTPDGSVSTVAIFTSQVHIYGGVPRTVYELPEENRKAALFQRGWNPPSAITVHLPETSVWSRTSVLL